VLVVCESRVCGDVGRELSTVAPLLPIAPAKNCHRSPLQSLEVALLIQSGLQNRLGCRHVPPRCGAFQHGRGWSRGGPHRAAGNGMWVYAFCHKKRTCSSNAIQTPTGQCTLAWLGLNFTVCMRFSWVIGTAVGVCTVQYSTSKEWHI
jgi:hypothetical protein